MKQADSPLSNMLSSKSGRTVSTVSRQSLQQLEASCKEQPQVEVPVVDYFAGGVYGRQVTIPAGVVLVGKIHKHDQINVLLRGTIQVATEEGTQVLTAPMTFISPAGVKRAGFTITETVWLTFHGTEHTELAHIEKEFIAPSYEDFDKFKLGVTNELDSNSSSCSNISRQCSLPATPEPKGSEEG